MNKGMLLTLVWVAVIGLTAWWAYKNLRPGFMGG